MTLSLSATCLAIAIADDHGTLTLTERTDRWGDTFISIADDHGTIEVANSMDDANARITELRNRRFDA